MVAHALWLTLTQALACFGLGAVLTFGVAARRTRARTRAARGQITRVEQSAARLAASAEVFESALILIEDGRPFLVAGEGAFSVCAGILGAPAQPARVIDAMVKGDPDHARRLQGLIQRGESCDFEVDGPRGALDVQGRAAGALAWLRLSVSAGAHAKGPREGRLAAFVDTYDQPAWIARADGTATWVNRAWLTALKAVDLADASARGLSFDRGADDLARGAAAARGVRERVRWVNVGGRRRAILVRAAPLDGGGVGVWTLDVTQTEGAADTLRRQIAGYDLVLEQIGDAVAVFGRDRRLAQYNRAFATLWDLDPAWLAEGPSHAEWLDRLRGRRRLPEIVNYAQFKATELARYEQMTPLSESIWRLPGERTLRVIGQPHPLGGLILLFSDMTPELRLKTQFNHLIQVQRATLDKLTDAVAVFGADGRLTLHNQAFAAFWNVSAGQLTAGPGAEGSSFDDIVELCVPRVHDLQFWRDLKGRISDPDPRARASAAGEVATSDGHTVTWQSRPLPDGATLVSFADVTDTRRLESAVADREAALSEAARLKHEFVGSVSYKLRAPLTTIIGYSELLERDGDGLTDRDRGYLAAVRSAASDLAGSINTVLTVAALDAGDLALERSAAPVARLLDEAVARWIQAANQSEVRLGVGKGDMGGSLDGDFVRLSQVLDSLIENALRHTPAGGAVTLTATRGQGEVRLAIADTGKGIPYHVQAHIFDRFRGQDAAAGLGLALVKALIELHGGWVALESEPGVGSTFTCYLPEAAG